MCMAYGANATTVVRYYEVRASSPVLLRSAREMATDAGAAVVASAAPAIYLYKPAEILAADAAGYPSSQPIKLITVLSNEAAEYFIRQGYRKFDLHATYQTLTQVAASQVAPVELPDGATEAVAGANDSASPTTKMKIELEEEVALMKIEACGESNRAMQNCILEALGRTVQMCREMNRVTQNNITAALEHCRANVLGLIGAVGLPAGAGAVGSALSPITTAKWQVHRYVLGVQIDAFIEVAIEVAKTTQRSIIEATKRYIDDVNGILDEGNSSCATARGNNG